MFSFASVVIIQNHHGRQEYSEVLKPYIETRQTLQLGLCGCRIVLVSVQCFSFDAGDVTLSVNVYDDGNIVSLVSATG